jgi:rSAM/selenodomain-associated transferase 2
MKLSVVIPTWNESENLAATLGALPRDSQVIVADGGSADGTIEIARRFGARVVDCGRGRALQMNSGAREAEGDTLLFLHADAVLEAGAGDAISKALSDPSVVGGSFRLRIRSSRPSLALVAFGSNLRARALGMPYGDQGLFVRREVFDDLGGFPALPFLEDVAFMRSLKRRGRLVPLDVSVSTGDRHWRELGVLLKTLLNWTMVGLYLAGVSPERLAPHYFRWRARGRRPRIAAAPQPD